MINRFREKYFFLSNFFPTEVTIDGITYLNAEAAFQSFKASSIKDKQDLSKMKDPVMAKRQGRKFKIDIEEWNKISEQAMYQVVKAKFSQNTRLRKLLLDTGFEYIEEGNMHHDNFWGVCRCNGSKCLDTVAHNKLGKILMKVRDELK